MFKKQEYLDRMEKLQTAIRRNNLQAFLVTAQDSIYYLTGVTYVPLERPFFILVRPDTPATLLVPALEGEHLASAPNVDEVHHYWEYPSPRGEGWPEHLSTILKGIKTLGIEPTMPQEIAEYLSDIKPKTIGLVEELRLVKSPAEIAKLRQSARYTDLGMEKIISASYKGVSEIEIFSQARAVQMKIIKETKFDALNTNLLTAAWPARLGTQPHGIPDIADRLEEGPHIALSLMRVNGYGAECERTFFVSPPTAKMKEIFKTMQEARQRAFALIRPGTPFAEIDQAANGFLRDEGLGDYLLHRTGHGFGLGTHEGPWIASGSEGMLTENMLISIEPGIYIPNIGGFRHSDTILVTRNGYESLTHYPRDLESLTLKSSKPLTRLRGALIRKAVGL